MQYEPLSRDELTQASVLKEGKYTFQVLAIKVTEKYWDVRLECSLPNNSRRSIFVKIFGSKQLGQFALAVGKYVPYSTKQLIPEMCIGLNCEATIGIEDRKPKNNGTDEYWPAKNKVTIWHPKPVEDEVFIDDIIDF